jgi:hypothetical protein
MSVTNNLDRASPVILALTNQQNIVLRGVYQLKNDIYILNKFPQLPFVSIKRVGNQFHRLSDTTVLWGIFGRSVTIISLHYA